MGGTVKKSDLAIDREGLIEASFEKKRADADYWGSLNKSPLTAAG